MGTKAAAALKANVILVTLSLMRGCVFICCRCVSCLSTRWKCYWDPEKHLCVSNKDESKSNLLEVRPPAQSH